ncbi:hypothetical protein B0T26DRAFT_710270, partial [Lasiosphaeria miniovina]
MLENCSAADVYTQTSCSHRVQLRLAASNSDSPRPTRTYPNSSSSPLGAQPTSGDGLCSTTGSLVSSLI